MTHINAPPINPYSTTLIVTGLLASLSITDPLFFSLSSQIYV
jgi:hypothetical protein